MALTEPAVSAGKQLLPITKLDSNMTAIMKRSELTSPRAVLTVQKVPWQKSYEIIQKRGNIHINTILRRVGVTVVVVEKQ